MNMNSKYRQMLQMALPVLVLTMAACSPEEENYRENVIDVTKVDSVSVVPNHTMLVANGLSQIDLAPRFFTADKRRMPDVRIKDEMLEYLTEDGVQLTRLFSTSDARLIGKTITGRLRVKGTQTTSAPFSFKVVAAEEQKYAQQITIPVVFHIVQTTEDVESFGGPYTKENVALQLRRLNDTFKGMTQTPIGVNTHIQFVPALYAPDGSRLHEEGVNRVVVESIDTTNVYRKFLASKKLLWSSEHYLNIWLISDRYGSIQNFEAVSANCLPRYMNAGATDAPEGLTLETYANQAAAVEDLGVLYRLQELLTPLRSFSEEKSPNDLNYYVGRYLGLLPTFTRSSDQAESDYCEDTHDYYANPKAYRGNATWYKEANGCYFRADNLMDDPTGTHTSVSRNQAIRMHWVLNNCAHRMAWKSSFALTGK